MKIPHPAIVSTLGLRWLRDLSARQGAAIISSQAPHGAGVPLRNFVSFSIEFSYFPDYAGNLTHPNTFSNNLLDNIASFSGSKPYIRVGGSSQDNALFVEKQQQEVILNFATPTADQPANLTFGPKFFDCYHTWPGISFVHGLNLKYNGTDNRAALLAQVPYACASLRNKLVAWELGNEADLYSVVFPGVNASQFPAARTESWKEPEYVASWRKWTEAISAAVKEHCPDVAAREDSWYAPSLANAPGLSSLDPVKAWEAGLDKDRDLKVFAAHHYQANARGSVTLQGTLMNHTKTIESVNFLVNASTLLHEQASYPADLPFILGEGNSLSGQGAPGLSNTFGAALWGIDASLLMASKNISRFHMHQGTNYRYQAWQPVSTNRTSIGTKAPYYGNIAVAAFLGNLTRAAHRPKVVNIDLDDEFKAAYASYVDGQLAKIMLINLHDHNTTVENNYTDPSIQRGVEKFTFQVPQGCRGKPAALQRLMANGSDAVTGATFDGYSFNYELDNGKPVLLKNITRGETARADRWGKMSVAVSDSSAVLVSFAWIVSSDTFFGDRLIMK